MYVGRPRGARRKGKQDGKKRPALDSQPHPTRLKTSNRGAVINQLTISFRLNSTEYISTSPSGEVGGGNEGGEKKNTKCDKKKKKEDPKKKTDRRYIELYFLTCTRDEKKHTHNNNK